MEREGDRDKHKERETGEEKERERDVHRIAALEYSLESEDMADSYLATEPANRSAH